MSTSPGRRREQPGTYGVPDRSYEEEMERLYLQNRLINIGMGGLLSEQPEPERFTSVLDVGCGPGGWLIEVAKAYPNIQRLVGIDINGKMLAFARKQAKSEGVSDRVEFLTMDAIREINFPDTAFDLINQRLGMSWLRTWDWTRLLQEYLRISLPGGTIRITEMNFMPVRSSSSALLQLCDLMVKASYQAGHLFRQEGDSLLNELSALLSRHDIRNVQCYPYSLEAHGGTLEGELLADDMQRLFRTTRFFLNKWVRLPDDYDEIHQRMVREMNAPDCVTITNFMTVWGTKDMLD
jgi:SAM-dependent methyltransferase